jgi:hypothetical protein
MYDGFDCCDMLLNLFHERKERIHNGVKYSMSDPSWWWFEVPKQRQNTMSTYQMTCEWFVAWIGAFRGHVRDALHHHINNMNICCQKLARSDYLRCLKNGTKVSSAKSGHS